jgi:hypothetical protein
MCCYSGLVFLRDRLELVTQLDDTVAQDRISDSEFVALLNRVIKQGVDLETIGKVP